MGGTGTTGVEAIAVGGMMGGVMSPQGGDVTIRCADQESSARFTDVLEP
jgi:hypothetical protein